MSWEKRILSEPNRVASMMRRSRLSTTTQDLPVLPGERVWVFVDRDEVVVGADLLKLAEGQEQRVAVPEPHVLDSGTVGADVRQGEAGLAPQLADLDAVQSPCLSRGDDVVL